MITKEEMIAFAHQQIKKKGLQQLEREAAKWAKEKGLITREKLLSMSKELQKRTTAELTAAYIRSLM